MTFVHFYKIETLCKEIQKTKMTSSKINTILALWMKAIHHVTQSFKRFFVLWTENLIGKVPNDKLHTTLQEHSTCIIHLQVRLWLLLIGKYCIKKKDPDRITSSSVSCGLNIKKWCHHESGTAFHRNCWRLSTCFCKVTKNFRL